MNEYIYICIMSTYHSRRDLDLPRLGLGRRGGPVALVVLLIVLFLFSRLEESIAFTTGVCSGGGLVYCLQIERLKS